MVWESVVIAVAVVLVYGAANVGGDTRSARRRARRARWVERHPEQVNSHDIRELLSRELLPEQVDLICARARALRIAPLTMLMWVRRHDVPSLALVVAAELSHRELLAHLGDGTTPDLAELEVLAGLNGLDRPTAGPASRAGRGAHRVRLGGSAAGPAARSTMPRIYEPGWPFPSTAADHRRSLPSPHPPPSGGGGTLAA